jgi:hypothetical protein
MSTRVTEAGEFFGTSAPDDGLVEAEIAAFDRFRRQFLGTGLSCIQASDIGAPSAENVDFVVIQTHLPFCFPFVFDRTQSVSRRYGRRPIQRLREVIARHAFAPNPREKCVLITIHSTSSGTLWNLIDRRRLK